jgi:hypothetical protein
LGPGWETDRTFIDLPERILMRFLTRMSGIFYVTALVLSMTQGASASSGATSGPVGFGTMVEYGGSIVALIASAIENLAVE